VVGSAVPAADDKIQSAQPGADFVATHEKVVPCDPAPVLKKLSSAQQSGDQKGGFHKVTPDGSLPEQVDASTGKPASARHLTWSHAAFVGAALARNNARASDIA